MKIYDFRFKNGITLIALIMTIIVLLILAGVSLSALVGDNGILNQATNASIETKIAEEKETIALAYNGAMLETNGKSVTAEGINSQFNKNGTKATAMGEETIKIDFTETGRSYIINPSGNVEEYIDISPYVKIGDYVDYHPDEVTTPYDKFGEIYTGYANGNIGQDDTLQWRVLNINNDGTVDLISDKPTSTGVWFKGARGYNNGVAILNDYCKTMYSNNSKGAVGKSLNIEDIQNHMKTNIEGKKAYEVYKSGDDGTMYREICSYSDYKWYPLQWKNDNGVEGESEPKKPTEIMSYAKEDNAKSEEKTGDLTVTQTFWYLNSSAMSSNFETADTRDVSKANSMYYELLCNNGSSSYWLTSRCVNTNGSFCASFGLRNVDSGNVGGSNLMGSYYYAGDPGSYYVRPIVSLPSNVLDLNTDYEAVGRWNLK